MSTLAIILISALGGGLVTGGSIWAIQAKSTKHENTAEILAAVKNLESSLDKAEATAIVSLTETDLLKTPCSSEYIEKQGNDLLCREMFCRMNRQGSGDGSTSTECEHISNMINSKYIIEQCLQYWDDSTADGRGINQNSKFSQCLDIYGKRK